MGWNPLIDKFFKRTWAEIDLGAVQDNYLMLREKIPQTAWIMGVVKADAYGHGVEFVSRELEKLGIDAFGVSSLSEAEQLRRFGHRIPVLILGYTPTSLAGELAGNDIIQTVYSLDYARELSCRAVEQGAAVRVHIKLDVGMGRLGLDASSDQCVSAASEICRLPGIKAEGLFTHFPSADFDGDETGEITKNQAELFRRRCKEIEAACGSTLLKHCCNSAGALTVAKTGAGLDMVREGISLYGLSPSKRLENAAGLRPAMELKTVVSMVKNIKKGDTVSYGRTFTAPGDMRVATVCIGYADGYPRRLSGRGYMLVNGKKAPIIGRICMDQLMLDVTGIEHVKEGMTVTVFGHDAGEFLPVDEVAELCDTINYELVCMVGKRIPRVFMKDGAVVAVTDYIKGE